MQRRQPRSKRTVTLFPDTTLCQSDRIDRHRSPGVREGRRCPCRTSARSRGRVAPCGCESFAADEVVRCPRCGEQRSEEHTSELQSLMRISYAVLCLKQKKHNSAPQLNHLL